MQNEYTLPRADLCTRELAFPVYDIELRYVVGLFSKQIIVPIQINQGVCLNCIILNWVCKQGFGCFEPTRL